MTTPFKVSPHQKDAELAVLGAILVNNQAMRQVVDLLEPDDFYLESHQGIFRAMAHLSGRNQPVDLVTLNRHLLETDWKAPPSWDIAYVSELAASISTSAGVRHHAEIVRELSLRRKLIHVCSSIAEDCFSRTVELDALFDRASQEILDLAKGRADKDFTPISPVLVESYTEIEKASKTEGFITGLPTGFMELDRLTGGLQPSDLIIVAARPSMGKTAFALGIAGHAARESGQGVAVFSLEMSQRQLGLRLLSMEARLNSRRLKAGMLVGEEWERLIACADRLSELPLFIDDSGGTNVLRMKTKLRRLMDREPVGLVVVDYLQLLRGEGRRSAESRQVEISEISRGLKLMAKDLDVPVLALSQLNRRVEERPGRRPQLSDLRESGAIEQDADLILFISREELYGETPDNRNLADLNLAKHRNGPTGAFRLTFLKDSARFENHAQEGAS